MEPLTVARGSCLDCPYTEHRTEAQSFYQIETPTAQIAVHSASKIGGIRLGEWLRVRLVVVNAADSPLALTVGDFTYDFPPSERRHDTHENKNPPEITFDIRRPSPEGILVKERDQTVVDAFFHPHKRRKTLRVRLRWPESDQSQVVEFAFDERGSE
jgi:hypothetical protein